MTTLTQNTPSVNGILVASGIGLLVSLAVAFLALGAAGHAAFNTSSSGVHWGLPVVNYVFFALTSTGLTLVASLALVFGARDFYPIAKRCIWLSLAAIVAGFVSLALELGHPFRLLWAIPTSAQFMSPLFWMGVFYLLFLVLGLAKFRMIAGGDWTSPASRQLGVACLVAELLAAITLGLAFGMMAMRPFWYDATMPLMFLAIAASSGCAFAVLMTYLAYGSQQAMPAPVRALMTGAMPKLFALALGVTIVAMLARLVTGLWSNADGLEVWRHMVGSFWFWLHLAALVAAMLLFLTPRAGRDGRMQALAAAAVIVALFIGQYMYVVGGQLVPVFKGAWESGLAEYAPSFTEWMLTLLAASITLSVWAYGEKRLDLAATPEKAA